jgi:DhnA family fructose-bisphosphate aldolase class Ia
VTRQAKGYVPAKDADTLVRQCGIAAGLGDSSVHLWLKVPIVDDLARVCRATTLPLLLLGGPARGTPEETLRDFASGLAAGPRVRGAIIGRNLLYPGDADPLPLSRALTALVHRGASLPEALERLAEPARPRRRAAAGRG